MRTAAIALLASGLGLLLLASALKRPAAVRAARVVAIAMKVTGIGLLLAWRT